MEKFKALMAKKKQEGSKVDPTDAAAHSSVLGDLMSSLDSHGSEKVKGLKKVTVASNSDEGMKSGLDKAKEIVGEGDKNVTGPDADDEKLEDEAHESPEYEDDNESNSGDEPVDHVSEAVASDKHSMHGFDGPDSTSHPDNSGTNLAKENEELKKEIARLRAPKPYY